MTVWPNGSTTIPTVTSEYGPRDSIDTPGGSTGTFHYGIDLVGFTLNRSPFKATVIRARYNGGAGNEVVLRRLGSDDEVRIKHNASFLVSEGQVIEEGTPVGVMGTTGMSTGVHCHYETWPGGGSTVNPRIAMAAWIGSTPAGGGGSGTIIGPNLGDTMNIIRRPSNGSITFADDLGAEGILDYISPDIGSAEYISAVAKLAPSIPNLTDREFDIISAVASRRAARYLDKVATAVAAKIKGGITVSADVDEAQLAQQLKALGVGGLTSQDKADILAAIDKVDEATLATFGLKRA